MEYKLFEASSDNVDLFDKEVSSNYITINGTKYHTKNSLGKYIYPTEQGIVNFYKWFGNSKVVDNQGRPLVVYHGSKTEQIFRFFDKDKSNSSLYHGSFWFTDNYDVALSYAKEYERDYVTGFHTDKLIRTNPIYEGYLRIQRPFMVDFEGANWDGDAFGKVSLYQYVFGEQKLIKYTKDKIFFPSYEEAYKRAMELGLKDDQYEIYTDSVHPAGATDDIINNELQKQTITKQRNYVGKVIERVFKNKKAHDGAIIKDVRDYGYLQDDDGEGNVMKYPSANDFIIFNANQFKSIDNKGYFSKSVNMDESFEEKLNNLFENYDKLNS